MVRSWSSEESYPSSDNHVKSEGHRTLRKNLSASSLRAKTIDPSEWWCFRRKLHSILESQFCEFGIGALILIDLGVVILETDATADGGERSAALSIVSTCVLMGYVVELLTRIYVFRMHFLCSPWEMADCALIATDLAFEISGWISNDSFPSVSILRAFRVVRLGRAVRVLMFFPELSLLIKGTAAAMRAILCGVSLIMIMFVFYSIVAVKVLHPINKDITYDGCDRCPDAFASVFDSLLTFIQTILAGDSWGQVSIPIIEREPWTMAFFVLVLVTTQLAILNLILAVIVGDAQKAQQNDAKRMLQEKQKEFRQLSNKLQYMFLSMDADQDGCLSFEELVTAFHSNADFRKLLSTMDVGMEDLTDLFEIMDSDHSGSVSYSEFVKELHKFKTRDMNATVHFLKQKVHAMHRDLQNHIASSRILQQQAGPLHRAEAQRSGDAMSKSVNQEDGTAVSSTRHEAQLEEVVFDLDAIRAPKHELLEELYLSQANLRVALQDAGLKVAAILCHSSPSQESLAGASRPAGWPYVGTLLPRLDESIADVEDSKKAMSLARVRESEKGLEAGQEAWREEEDIGLGEITCGMISDQTLSGSVEPLSGFVEPLTSSGSGKDRMCGESGTREASDFLED